MIDPLRIYIGWDPREVDAFRVAVASMHRHSSMPLAITPLRLPDLELSGLMRRPRRMVPSNHHPLMYTPIDPMQPVSRTMWDEISGAPMATEFAITRFLTPLLCRTGWALFVDCDVVFEADPAELFGLADPEKALMCVQHPIQESGAMGSSTKMDGQPQVIYSRKNWSSVMLFNCDHPANRALDLALINSAPGRDLHRFCWLDEHWIGALPREWNWLVGITPRPERPKLSHFTLGGPWLPGWEPHLHDDLWLAAAADLGT